MKMISRNILYLIPAWLLLSGFCFEQAGTHYNISPVILGAISWVESNHTPGAIGKNRNGSLDCGHMQINTFWAETIGPDYRYLKGSEPEHACYQTYVGAWILRQCIDRYGNTWDAVACYHAGHGFDRLHGQKKERALQYVNKVVEAIKNQKYMIHVTGN